MIIWECRVALVFKQRSAHRILEGMGRVRDHLEDLDVNGKIH
jgi:hypothetical protein